jgi:hypothetical protein
MMTMMRRQYFFWRRDVSGCAFCLAFDIFGSGILGTSLDIGKIISEKRHQAGGCDCSISSHKQLARGPQELEL